MAHFTRV